MAALLLSPAPLRAEARLEVSGVARAVEARLVVDLKLANAGDGPAVEPRLRAGLGRDEQLLRLAADLGPGATSEQALVWPLPRAGVHALRLRLDYRDGAGGLELQQPAWLLVSVGEAPPPAIEVRLPDEVRLEHHALLEVRILSRDGRPHQARLDVVSPDGLRVLDHDERVAVPAEGERAILLRLLRSGAPVGTVQGLVVVAGTLDSLSASATAATTRVRVVAPPLWTQRVRTSAVVIAVLILIGGSLLEWRRLRVG